VNRAVARLRRSTALHGTDAERGMSLAELLVAMTIMAMVAVAVVTLTIGIQRTNGRAWGRTDDTTAAQYAFRVIEKAVPYALRPQAYAEAMTTPVLAGDGNRLDVIIRDPDSVENYVLVEFEIADQQLVERRTSLADIADADELRALLPLSAGCEARTCETRTLVDGLLDGSGLDYLDRESATVEASGAVAAIEFTLVVRTNPRQQETPSTHRDRIHLKNVGKASA